MMRVRQSPLEVALHPYLSIDWKYVSISKGVNNILTIIDKDGKSKICQINYFSSKDCISSKPLLNIVLFVPLKTVE